MTHDPHDGRAGSLVAQALGDALGFLVEGHPPGVCTPYADEVFAKDDPPPFFRGPVAFGQYSDNTRRPPRLRPPPTRCAFGVEASRLKDAVPALGERGGRRQELHTEHPAADTDDHAALSHQRAARERPLGALATFAGDAVEAVTEGVGSRPHGRFVAGGDPVPDRALGVLALAICAVTGSRTVAALAVVLPPVLLYTERRNVCGLVWGR